MAENKRKKRLGQVETNRHRDRCLQHLVARQEERNEAAGRPDGGHEKAVTDRVQMLCMVHRYYLELLNSLILFKVSVA